MHTKFYEKSLEPIPRFCLSIYLYTIIARLKVLDK